MTMPLGDGLRLREIKLGPKLTPANLQSAKWLCSKYALHGRITQSTFAYRS